MDDKTNPVTSGNPQPSTSTTGPSLADNSFTTPTSPLVDLAPTDTAVPSSTVTASVTQAPKDDVMPDLANESDTPPNDAPKYTPADPSAVSAPNSVVPQPSAAIKKNSMSKVVLVVILVVAALATAGYFAFLKPDNTPAKTSGSTPVSTEVTEDTTPEDTDSAIETDLNSVDDTKDFSSDDINDTTLGL